MYSEEMSASSSPTPLSRSDSDSAATEKRDISDANFDAAASFSSIPPSPSIASATAEDFSTMSLAASASFDFSSSSAMLSSVGFTASIAAMRERKNSISSSPRLFVCESDSIFKSVCLRSE